MTAQTPNVMAAITAAIHQRNTPKTGNPALAVVYPYQQVPPGTSLVCRPIPAKGGGDSGVVIPWRDLYQHRLKFAGIRGSDHDNDDEVVVMFNGGATWNLSDPVNIDIKGLWDTDRDLARSLYHSRITLMPVIIVTSPIVEKVETTLKGRVLKSGPQLTKATEAAMLNGGYDFPVWDWEHGRDLVIPVSMQGGFRHYSASFRGKERAVPVEERLTDAELPDLDAIIGDPPSDEAVRLQWELYLACRDGEPFDNARFGRHFKAYSNRPTNGHSAAPAAAAPISAEHRQAAADQLAALRQKNRSTSPTS